jgi:Kef-type K+ transport system membrane component KefB
MPEFAGSVSLSLLIIGGLLALSIVLRPVMRGLGLPPLVGFILLGFGLRLADSGLGFLSADLMSAFQLLAGLGIFALLFRVGLESKLDALLREFPRAAPIWLVSVLLSGALGYLAGRHIVGLQLIPSLFIAVAFTATSVGVSTQIWQEAGALKSRRGSLLIDVAELDDLSAVFLMVLLLGIAPILSGAADGSVLAIAGWTALALVAKVLLFGALCVLFSRYLERPITRYFARHERPPDLMLLVAGVGVLIAAFAGLLGLSLAVGALFAGLVFSRDPEAVHVDASFGALYDLFVPFFFIGIGLQFEPASFGLVLAGVGVLFAAAVIGKVIGAGLPALALDGLAGASVIGVSMVPRAEIALVILDEGRRLGPWAVSSELFATMVLVSLATCIAAPILLRPMLARWPPPTD